MSVNKIATRYAKSLLDLAIEENKLDNIMDDIKGLKDAFKNRDLMLFFKSPIIKPNMKLKITEKIFCGKIDKLTMAFLQILIKKGRDKFVPDVANAFVQQYKKYNRQTDVTIITAQKMDATQLEKIKKQLLESNITEDFVEIETEVDPEIIGGFILQIGDKRYDASVMAKLENIKKDLEIDDYIKAI